MQTKKFEITPEVTISYRDSGLAESSALLFCHGLGVRGEQFLDDAKYFSEKGVRVLVPDLRGHGDSTRPVELLQEDFSVARMAEDILALLNEAGVDKVHWVGNSLGGNVGLELIKLAPERVLSLTTFGTTYALSMPYAAVVAKRVGTKLMGKKVGKLVAKTGTSHEAVKPKLEALFEGFDRKVSTMVDKNIYKFDYLNTARQFDGPIQLLQGSEDKEINAHLDSTLEVLNGRQNSRVLPIDDAAHFTNLDQPEKVRSAISEWIKAVG